MKTFNTRAAQGEIQIRRISAVPTNVEALSPENGKLIIGHSETGHHHVLEHPTAVSVSKDPPEGMRILYALLEEPNALIHERGHDTHEAIRLEPGVYEFRIGREFDPYAELARRQMD